MHNAVPTVLVGSPVAVHSRIWSECTDARAEGLIKLKRRSRSAALTPGSTDGTWLAQGGRAACSCMAIQGHVAVSAGSETALRLRHVRHGG